MSSRVERVSGRALPLRGHDIDTDRIIPARYLKAVSFEGLERHVFADDRSDPAHAFNQPPYQGASVLLVNRNFGCGSSREHAPQAIQRWGIRAIVGEGYSEIFFGNSVQLGLPCLTVSPGDVERLMGAVEADPALVLDVDVAGLSVTAGTLHVAATMPPAAHDALVTGLWDGTGLLLADYDQVRATAERLPYVTGRWQSCDRGRTEGPPYVRRPEL
jgi:3-isopropylmalate/(R)-2-methylmalate dehydratase small subunit